MEPTDLFWTGGWDSTFRLCQLLLEQRAAVQPIYIENRRRSRRAELKTMQMLQTRLASAGPLLLPTLRVDRRSLALAHRSRNLRILRHHRLGFQYDQLARFRESYPHEIEIGIEKPHRTRNVRHVQAGFVLAPMLDANGRLRDTVPEELRDLRQLFDGMRFPLVHLTKPEMLRIAEAAGYGELLRRTWSCLTPARTPRRNAVPCGRCRPCRLRIARCRIVITKSGARIARQPAVRRRGRRSRPSVA
ncbi:MAG: 7-cyano-7-deazaguanine synthase [Acidobacteria bacterium]|nr:7-cyano-7-deazaguanine synthase [Acidobacteriota bacterium]